MPKRLFNLLALPPLAFAVSACIGGGGDEIRSLPPVAAGPAPTYADFVTYGEAADLVAVVNIAEAVALKPERAPNVAPGMVRFYVEGETQRLLYSQAPVGEVLTYLVDLPLDPEGKPPKIEKAPVIVFAKAGRVPGEIQLIAPDAQLPATPTLIEQTLAVMSQLSAADAPPRVSGVRDVLSVPGNLAGESETQIFFASPDDATVTATILRRPGQQPRWGVSWSEIVDQSAAAPANGTLEWYRLACSLPDSLPSGVLLTESAQDRARAESDYRVVRDGLGPCLRNRT